MRYLLAACVLIVSVRPAHAEGARVLDGASPWNDDRCTPTAVDPGRWTEPLDRRVSVRGGTVSLRDALDRVAAAARVRLTYSDALLSLEQRVCLALDRVPLGDALVMLVRDAAVAPRAAGRDLVVLAPRDPAGDTEARPAPVGERAAPLERVVVTGSATGGAQRALGVALGVVDGAALEAHAHGSVSGFLNGTVPGIWLWQQSPAAVLARYGSIRGASSFGVSHPKVYVDGVEVANPLVVAHMPPESVERLEVLRGPQGAALYGTDAISGVVHIVTRPPVHATDAPSLRLRMQGGRVASAFAETGTYGQEMVLAGQRGDATRAAAGSLAFTHMGAFVPDGDSRHFAASARARVLGARSVLEGTARLAVSDVAATSNPLLLDALGDALTGQPRPPAGERARQQQRDSLARHLQLDRTLRQSLQQFTGGLTGTLYTESRWTHRAVLGLDTYALDGSSGGVTPLPSSSDSALRAAEGSATRVSARTSSAATWSGDAWQRTITLSAEQAWLHEAVSNGVLARPGSPDVGAPSDARPRDVHRQTTGAVAQTDLAWRDAFFVMAGTRVERSAGFTTEPLVTVLPMLGVSLVRDYGGATVKLRAAYGKGIRPPRITVGGAPLARTQLLPNADLQPEAQAGTEFGLDLFAGRRAALHVTRFDQRATGLVQPVSVALSAPPGDSGRPGDPMGRHLAFQMQNVGAIDNRGWELEGVLRSGAFLLHGSFALVDSRVREVRRGYTGDLRIGDRMLDVPAQTMGVSARWSAAAWGATLQVTRAADWIGYDRLAASRAFVMPGNPSTQFVGQSLRRFWTTYPGVTRLHATMSRDLPHGFTLHVKGENLLGRQTGEPDNITIVPGRTISAGVRARF